MTLSEQSALFASPDREYRPVPWWCWTGAMTEREMQRQLEAMREQGIYEFFIFPIYGLETAYLSEEYLEQVGFALEYCRRHGMKAWIYDEYTWPSGVCAGFVLRDHPWSRYTALRWETRAAAEGERVEVQYRGEFVLARAVTADGRAVDLPALSSGQPLVYSGRAATITVFSTQLSHVRYPYAFGADWLPQEEAYVDTLNAAAVRKFIEYTHDRYAGRFGEDMPRALPGFFTDEPCIQEMLPYTGELFAAFRERYDYALEPRLHELVVDVGDYRRTRYDYWRLVSELFGSAYHRQIRQWCDEHGVLYTGHLLAEETLLGVLRYNGDIWEASRWMSAPGIDMLANMTGYGHSQSSGIYGDLDARLFHVTVKLIASTCRHTGAKRMLSEAFGVCTFGLTAADMRWGANWQAALGVNLFNDNTLEYSIAGFRKWMFSGKHFTTPWFQRYRLFSDYCARLCRMHAEGERIADVAVLYPRTSTFCLANDAVLRNGKVAAWQTMQEAVAAVTDALVRHQWDFDFLYEQLIEGAVVRDGGLVVGDARYRAVILPAAAAIPAAVAGKLSEFARAGGILLAVHSLPAYCPDAEVDPAAELSSARVLELDASLAERLDAALAGALPRMMRVSGDKARMITASRRRYADGDAFFVANMDAEVAAVEVEMPGGPACEVWDPDDGTVSSAEAVPHGDGCRVPLELAPGQAIFLRPCERADAPSWAVRPSAEAELDEHWRFSVKPGNILRLALEARFDPEGRGEAQHWYRPDAGGDWLEAKDSLLPVDLTPEEAREYWVRARVSCSRRLEDLRLVVDNDDFVAAYLDGHALSSAVHFTLWDQENLAYALPPLAPGEHVIALRAMTSKYHSPRMRGSMSWPLNALPPVALVGDFGVETAEAPHMLGARPAVVHTGDWGPQGYPYFAGVGEYAQVVRAPSSFGRAWLDFGLCRDIIEIELNGRVVGTRAWPPYRVEVTEVLRPGDNDLLVRVFSTLGNLLWEHYSHAPRRPVPCGLLGPCRLMWTE